MESFSSTFKKIGSILMHIWGILTMIGCIIYITWFITLWVNAKDNKDIELNDRVTVIENAKLDIRVSKLEDTFKDFADTNKKLLTLLSRKEKMEIET